MAKQNINIGTAANSRNGDSIRTAFSKVNDNFTELYLQIPSQINNSGKLLTTNGTTLTWVSTIDGGTASSTF
jgi:hypothetical protein